MLLGQLNTPDLGNYKVQPVDLTDMQNFGLDQMRTFLSQRRSVGVLSGCAIIPGTGLDVKIQPGLILFPDGKIAYLAVETVVAIDAAHATLPRLDRIEAVFSIVNSRTGVNMAAATVVCTKLHVAALSSNTGTAGASPSADATTSGSISLGLVTVAPLSTTVSLASIDQSLKNRDNSRELPNVLIPSINNAQAVAVALKDVIVDKTKYRQVIYEGNMYRKDAGQSKTAWVKFILMLNILDDTWVFIPSIEGEAGHGVTFSFDQATQQVKYVSSNFAGATYLGELALTSTVIER